MKVKAIICPCDGRKPYTTNISPTLKNLQKLVGGYIETPSLPVAYGMQPVVAIINEEGRLIGLPRNHCLHLLDVVGDAVLLAVDGDELVGLDDETANRLLALCIREWNLYYNQTPARVPV